MRCLQSQWYLAIFAVVIRVIHCKNVLFIIVDDLRPDLGCYRGADFPSFTDPPMCTPNIDKLASQSLLFKRAYVQQAVCSPSRTSFLTSRRPDTTLVYDLKTYFRNVSGNFTTIPQYFKNHGHISVGFGKIFHTPESSGNDDPISWSVPVRRPAPSPWENFDKSWNYIPDNKTKTDPLVDMKIAKYAVRSLRDFAHGGKFQNRPFFLAVGFIRPHLPFVSPSSFKRHYPDNDVYLPHNPFPPVNMPAVAWFRYTELTEGYKDIQKLNASATVNSTLPDNVVLDLRRAYYSAVSYVDSMVGLVLDELEHLGLAKNTIVALLGDHGYQLGEHGLWCKHTNFELATHAPLMIRVPGRTDGGVVSENVAEFVDIFPTLVDASGLPPLQTCQDNSKYVRTCTEGQSLMPLVSHPSSPLKDAAFSQYPRYKGKFNIMGYTMRTDKYRYTEWPEFSFSTHTPDWSKLHGIELYDHTLDPDENINKAEDPAYITVKQELKSKLRAGWRASFPSVDSIAIG